MNGGPFEREGGALRCRAGDCSSFILGIEHIPQAVEHPAVLRDRRINAGPALSIDELDGLWHGVWIFAAVIQRLEAQPGAVHMRVLRTLVGRAAIVSQSRLPNRVSNMQHPHTKYFLP
jgi:hypothetical protein